MDELVPENHLLRLMAGRSKNNEKLPKKYPFQGSLREFFRRRGACRYRFSCFSASMGLSLRITPAAYIMVAKTTAKTLPAAITTLYQGI